MGNTCIPVADSFRYLAKPIQYCKVKKEKKRKEMSSKERKKKRETTTDKGVFLSSVCCSLMEGGVCSLRAPSREQKHHSDFSPHFSAGTDALRLWGVYFGVNAVPLI